MSDHHLAAHEATGAVITGMAQDYASGSLVPMHEHGRSQLLCTMTGVLRVDTPQACWVVPPSRALWLGPGVPHRLRMRSATRVRCVFVDGRRAGGLPQHDGVLPVSPLLQALVDELARLGLQTEHSRRGRLLAALLREELAVPQEPAFQLPWPVGDSRIEQVCLALTSGQAPWERRAGQWAERLAMSLKTFERHFQRQTGMSFGQWRLRARLLASLDGLVAGQPILPLALACGYESHSAYTYAFRRHFGVTPKGLDGQARAPR